MASSQGNYHRRGPYFDAANFASWKLSWVNTITYGAISSFVVRQGGGHVAQRTEAMMQHDNDDSGDFYPSSGYWDA